jgi:hypothetical protein
MGIEACCPRYRHVEPHWLLGTNAAGDYTLTCSVVQSRCVMTDHMSRLLSDFLFDLRC